VAEEVEAEAEVEEADSRDRMILVSIETFSQLKKKFYISRSDQNSDISAKFYGIFPDKTPPDQTSQAQFSHYSRRKFFRINSQFCFLFSLSKKKFVKSEQKSFESKFLIQT